MSDRLRDPAVLAELLTRWYTLHDLADRWRVSRETVGHWLSAARARGHGPNPEQQDTRRIGRGGVRRVLLRADYCLILHSYSRGTKILTATRIVSGQRNLEPRQGRGARRSR